MAVQIRKTNAPRQPVTVQVPGKLVLAGEYAVLAPGEPGLVAAVWPGLEAHWVPGDATCVAAPDMGVPPMPLSDAEGALPFVHHVARLLEEAYGRPVTAGTLTLSGTMSHDGKKLGLGSSASACVAAVRGWLGAMELPAPPEVVFRLAVVAHGRCQRLGSGIDVAAASFGGIGRFTSLGAEWLAGLAGPAILTAPFPAAPWQPLAFPAEARLCVGFTGQSAATVPAVEAVIRWAEANPEAWIAFASQSRQAVNVCMRGLQAGQLPTVQMGLREARRALRDLGQAVGLLIETPLLAALADSAEALGASGKSSGAGGGDCGIALVSAGQQESQLLARWQQYGIVPVAVSLAAPAT